MASAVKSVTVIPPKAAQVLFAGSAETKKKRVAAYARVSTDDEEQMTSYAAQIDYYTRHIQEREDWTFAGMYADVDMPYGQIPKSGVQSRGILVQN